LKYYYDCALLIEMRKAEPGIDWGGRSKTGFRNVEGVMSIKRGSGIVKHAVGHVSLGEEEGRSWRQTLGIII
jgi:hypothetical protein